MSTSLVIGNMARGFHVIAGFGNEDEALNFVAENKRLVGQEYRLATCYDKNEVKKDPRDLVAQDALSFGKPAINEALDPNTGLSTDTEDRTNANRATGGQDHPGAEQVGSGSGGDGAPLPNLLGAGESGDGTVGNIEADRGDARGGHGASGEDNLKDPLHPGEENG